ncbi:TlpA family protein disulfide reductase [Snuella sedimenti]|uniref:TlpA family protein disulfide reductase n=1 Tax=Snuella sedimenti TaxID=2798802 RepID=A0A8J7IGV8_9FLAO|nr:TlpA disulfide reductase family protein [Snuella sedimenti]MBJ6367276.1 TlpA family protein disulfide reductase [Snuella sedimenti]
MKLFKTVLLLLFSFVTAFADNNKGNVEAEAFTITGDLTSYYTEGTIKIVGYPKKASSGGGGIMMMGGSTPNEIVYAEGPVTKGTFKISGKISKPQNVYIYINAKNKQGILMGATKGMNFILSSGDFKMTLGDRPGVFTMTGGDNRFNEIIFAYKSAPEYIELQDSYGKIYTDYNSKTEAEKAKVNDEAVRISGEMIDYQLAHYLHVAKTVKDKDVLLMLFDSASYGGPWIEETRKALINICVEDAQIKDIIFKAIDAGKARAAKNKVGVGSDMNSFYAETLEGKAISLKDVCSKEENKFVLLEFWASWCGPCRSEIPHMKEAYSEYNPKGFEIFSFTIDDSRAAWQKASKEENLPWIDSGMGTKTGPKELYGITGVPANFLVDTSTGKIVAINLRGEKLTQKLKELLD